ncbi:MAG: beta-eliminating lyase-related protein [Bacteroidota bacterium]
MSTPNVNRRNFLRNTALSALPFLLSYCKNPEVEPADMGEISSIKRQLPVNFIFDGLALSAEDYLNLLQKISSKQGIQRDSYAQGGVVKALEEKFATITGKEKAIFLPTGIMANQLALKFLNGHKAKVMVAENAHIFRDEGDAAQSIHHKRLVPVGKGKPFFELNDLKEAIKYINRNEIFKSGIGTVALETPVRRADSTTIPLQTVKAISAYCKQEGYKMHLDGARLHLASAYTQVPLLEYCAHFDTVYMSLYKYLHATGGAVLCGEAELIDQLTHQRKILGGTVYQNWSHAAVALHFLESIEERWQQVIKATNQLIAVLNEQEGVQVNALPQGTNIYHMKLNATINPTTLVNYLHNEYNMLLGGANAGGFVKFVVNESLLTRDIEAIITAWKIALQKARV